MAMKSLFVVLFFFSQMLSQAQDSLSVIFIKGKVLVRGQQIVQGQKISLNDTIRYHTGKEVIAAISTTRGRVLIKFDSLRISQGSELIYTLKNIVLPMKTSAMTRTAPFISDKSIRAHFGRETYLLLPNNCWEFSKTIFPLSKESFFFIRYRIRSNNSKINKKLSNRGNCVLVNRQDFLIVDGVPISTKDVSDYELYYSSDGKARMISPIQFYIPDDMEIENELKIIKESSIDNGFEEAKSYIYWAYGNYDIDELKKIYDKL